MNLSQSYSQPGKNDVEKKDEIFQPVYSPDQPTFEYRNSTHR